MALIDPKERHKTVKFMNMPNRTGLIIAALVNLVLALSSGVFLTLALCVFIADSSWSAHLDYMFETVFFWLLAFIVLSSHTLYLRSRIKNPAGLTKGWLKTGLLIGNLILTGMVGFYGLKSVALEISFTNTFWHFNVWKAAAVTAFFLLFMSVNITMLLRRPGVETVASS